GGQPGRRSVRPGQRHLRPGRGGLHPADRGRVARPPGSDPRRAGPRRRVRARRRAVPAGSGGHPGRRPGGRRRRFSPHGRGHHGGGGDAPSVRGGPARRCRAAGRQRDLRPGGVVARAVLPRRSGGRPPLLARPSRARRSGGRLHLRRLQRRVACGGRRPRAVPPAGGARPTRRGVPVCLRRRCGGASAGRRLRRCRDAHDHACRALRRRRPVVRVVLVGGAARHVGAGAGRGAPPGAAAGVREAPAVPGCRRADRLRPGHPLHPGAASGL
ncbi:MAG: Aklanonic acid methyltransferase, partial [uncultured Acidimicrobiales bacterium]